jgi:hypothetical protein
MSFVSAAIRVLARIWRYILFQLPVAHERSVPVKHHYHYTQLEQGYFRLLVLQPGPVDAPLVCSLRVVNLHDFNDITGRAKDQELDSYEAVSYVWSNPWPTVEIECDGAQLYITESLDVVFRRYRWTDRERILWADGVCINQADVEERKQQVQLMGLIYWNAQQCLVWLGYDDEPEEQWSALHAVKLLQSLGDLYHDDEVLDTVTISRTTCSINELDGGNTSCWEALRRLMDKKWFTRVWVVQELGLSRRTQFFCGAVSFSGDQLWKILSLLSSEAPSMLTMHDLNLRMLRLSFAYTESTRGQYRIELGNDPTVAQSFLEVLEFSRGLHCTDMRDTIYAFLGHPSAFKRQLLDVEPYMWYPRNFHQGKKTVIEPAYDNATSHLDVYGRVAYAAIHDWGLGFDVLCHVTHDETTIEEDFPSWIPRWDIAESCLLLRQTRALFSASADLIPTSPLAVDFGSEDEFGGLQLKALLLGTVCFSRQLPAARHFELLPPEETACGPLPTDYYNPIEELCTELDGIRPSFATPLLSTLVDLACTLTAGVTWSPEHALVGSDTSSNAKNFDAYRRAKILSVQEPQSTPTNTLPAPDDAGDAVQFLNDMNCVISYRGFFATSEGRLGLGPRITKNGDQVWLPMGASMPFVLRPLGEKSFSMVGLTYLHGVMRGEAVAGLTEDDFEDILLI